ncbi:MAG: DUF6701 domain-containing protein [Burkholderiales bacterium]
MMAPRSHTVRRANARFAAFKAVTLFLALAWLNVWCGVVIAAPSFQAAGTADSGNGTANPAWPTHQINDIALLFVESAGGEAATLSTPAGFVAVTNSPQSTGTGTNGARITVFWARATSTSMATPRVADPGNHVSAQILTYRGVVTTGNPWDITGGGVKATASTSITVTGVTTTVPDTLIVQTVSRDNDSAAAAFSGQTNASLTSITERTDTGTTSGNGGGFAVWDGVKATAGATGNTTATVTSSSNAFLTIALKPPSATTVSINRAGADPSNAATVAWTVTFSSSVSGVDASAFTLAATGISGAFISSVTGSGTTWTVTANSGIGSGALGLNQTGAGSVSPTLIGTFTGQVYTITSTPALAEYRMDEASWNGSAGEVVDSAGSFPGRAMNSASTTNASPALAGNPGTCSYGVFDNGGSITQGYVELPGFPNLNTDFTITAWIRTTNNTVAGQRIVIDDENGTGGYGLSLADGGTGALRFYARGSSVVTLDTPLNTIANNTWYFIAGVADITNGVRMIYVYDAGGNLLPGMPVSVASTGWGVDAGMASLGAETNASGESPATFHFKGNLDEVRVYPKVLSQSALAAIALQTHACPVVVVTAGGFNAYETGTAAGSTSGVIKTKTAGSTVSLDIIALNAAKTAISTTFTGAVKIEVLDASNNSGALDANGCRPTWSVIQTLANPTFAASDNGRKTISFTQANAYRDVRLRITYPTTSPTATGCSTDNFAIRPSAFTNLAVTDTDWQTAGTTRALNSAVFGALTHKAGRPVSVRADAVNAAGSPAITTNYAGTPTATLTACVGAACTSSVGALSLVATFVSGQLASNTASYNEVGSFQLQLVDSSFAAVDGADGSTAAERNIASSAITVGRFIPDHFAVSLNTPAFGTACGSFTYVGQKFNYTTVPVITVTAQDFANNTTTLYATAGSWWRISNATLTSKTYAAATGALDTSGVPGTDPAIVSSGAGVGTLTFSSGTGLLFDRTLTPPQIPPAPYNADISLGINVIDADGVGYASNPVSFGAATAGNGIAFASGKTMRFGRLRLSNASGSQLISMPIRMETQYSNGTGFVTAADTCTSISTANIALGNYQKNLNAGETAVTSIGAFSGGVAWLRLSAPGAANNGSVDVSVNLTGTAAGSSCTAGMPASTGSGLSHLQGAWCGAPYSRDPTARATFGVNTNSDRMIYQRENF